MSESIIAFIPRYKSLSFLGFPKYRVGNDGTVWSRHNWRGKTGTNWRKLTLKNTACRYKFVTLCDSPKRESYMVHQLVLLAFVGPCPEGMEGCHNNGIQWDNRLENLRWDTHKNNEADKTLHGTRLFGDDSPMSKLTSRLVNKIHDLWEGGCYTRKELAARFEVHRGLIDMILRGVLWKHVWDKRYPNGRPEKFNRPPVHNRHKLTDANVVEIRSLYKTGKYRQVDLAEMFGIYQSYVSYLIRNA